MAEIEPLQAITNYIQLTDRVGTSGQPSPEQFADIAAAGYGTVINLAMADSEHAVPSEGSIVAGLGMRYVHIPVPFDAPSAQDLEDFCGIMATLRTQKVWVHCAVNARVSAFMYQYLTQEKGFAPDDATTPLLTKWRPKMDRAWQEFMAIKI